MVTQPQPLVDMLARGAVRVPPGATIHHEEMSSDVALQQREGSVLLTCQRVRPRAHVSQALIERVWAGARVVGRL
eukprot:748401-Rhodomonas_salina.1